MKNMALLFKIGDAVKYKRCYAMTCSKRFPTTYDPQTLNENGRTKEPVCMDGLNMTGFVVGLKRAIMADYVYQKGYSSQSFEDPCPDIVPAYATGKYEECLVCIKDITRFKPFLVRKQDIIPT